MTNEKNKFESKGKSRKLIFDNGQAYQTKGAFRGDYKSAEERKYVKEHMNFKPSD